MHYYISVFDLKLQNNEPLLMKIASFILRQKFVLQMFSADKC